ncbi:IS1 family transposase [Candidatus Enterovibrio altilux]|uniref:IS1 family transposase n=1 Tax=Candidatus Enterovibrio altilux TaxID=1927128 RepID=UPI0013747AE3
MSIKEHIVGKLYTQCIDRDNVILHIRLKWLNSETIGYSHLPEMHNKIFSTFIKRAYHF